MHYLDSSAIVKIYINETGSAWMRELRRLHQKGERIICEISGGLDGIPTIGASR